MDNGNVIEQQGFKVEAIPMYNLPENDKSFHAKGRGNGYVIEKDSVRVYVSGDTSGTPEMKNLKDIDGLQMPNMGKGRVYQDFIVRTEKRNDLYEFLKGNGIETMKNEYPMPCGKLPNAAKYEAETLRLPINEVLTDEEVKFVILKIKEFYGRP